MLHAIHLVLVIVYALLPVWMLWTIVARRTRTNRAKALVSFLITCFIGIILAIAFMLLNGQLMSLSRVTTAAGGGRIFNILPAAFTFGEIARLGYFIIGALCLVRLVDRITNRGVFQFARIKLDQWGRPRLPNEPRALVALLSQRILMLLLVIPYFLALMMVYRPRLQIPGDPAQHNLSFETASFQSADGIRLRGWWINSHRLPAVIAPELAQDWGRRTVIICHGIGSAKERYLDLAAHLAARGFNVLVFDFRAHGESSGNFVSYGIRERFDVAAAIEWTKANHAAEAQHLFGLGANTGAAALLSAALQPGAGDQLEGVVLYEPFARFDNLLETTSRRVIPGPASWLVEHISLPLASLHAGGDLRGLAPIDAIDGLWPRPVLVVHGRAQTFVPTEQSMSLYQQASQPKEQFFPADNYYQQRDRARRYRGNVRLVTEMFKEFLGTSDSISDDAGVRYRTVKFLDDAQPVPIL